MFRFPGAPTDCLTVLMSHSQALVAEAFRCSRYTNPPSNYYADLTTVANLLKTKG